MGVELKCLEFKANEATIRVHYSVDEGATHFHLGKKSTFGDVEFSGSEEFLPLQACVDLLFQHVDQNYKKFTIKFAPSFYPNDISTYLQAALLKINNGIVVEDCNQSMLIPADIDVVDNFSRTNRRIYRRLKGKGYRVSNVKYLTREAYDLLEENRQNRNVSLSLSYDDLVVQAQYLKNEFHFFECRDQQEVLCAFAVTLSMSSEWLYVFYWGERGSHRQNSPVVLLAAEIMRYCQRHSIKRLDAGTSSVSGIIDQNLFDFKRRLGFVPSPKITVLG